MKCKVCYFSVLQDNFGNVITSPKFDKLCDLQEYLYQDYFFEHYRPLGFFKAVYDYSIDSISVFQVVLTEQWGNYAIAQKL